MPPGPTIDTSRFSSDAINSASSTNSSLRPTRGVSAAGRLLGLNASRFFCVVCPGPEDVWGRTGSSKCTLRLRIVRPATIPQGVYQCHSGVTGGDT